MNPVMTIIVTSYNRPTLVVDAIESIKEQTYPHLQAIIADDDSSQETLDAVHRTIAGDSRFLVLEKVCGSPAPAERKQALRYCMAINEAIGRAVGDFFSYLPDDDYLMPGCFEARVNAFDANPEEHVVYTKQRSLTFDVSAFWDSQAAPRPGRTYPKEGEIDPDSGIPVDIASWWPGHRTPIRGIDHGMLSHRRVCLAEMGGPPWWPTTPVSDVGDGLFFDRLTALGHAALAIDAIGHTKRFHGRSYGRVGTSPVRE